MAKILHIDTERGWRGGENQALTLAIGLRKRGHENLFLTQPDSDLYRRAKEKGFEVVEARMRGDWDLLARRRIRRIVAHVGADIIHAHTSHAHALGLAVADRRGGRPRLVISRRVDFVIGKGFWSRRKYLSPLCHYIAISNGVKKALEDGGVPSDRIRVVHSGVDPNRFTFQATGESFRREMGCAPGDLLVGNVAALTDHKGHVYLIAAAAKVAQEMSNVRFCVCGEGELKETLIAKVRQQGLAERFRFAGFRTDIEECMKAFDLFALSSHLEGLCTALIDAMLLGVPVVATDTGGVPDLVRDGQTGLLVAPKNPEALAAAIVRMLRDEDLRRRLSGQARALALIEFTNEQMVAGTEKAYSEILESR